jgi:hypothetical protein
MEMIFVKNAEKRILERPTDYFTYYAPCFQASFLKAQLSAGDVPSSAFKRQALDMGPNDLPV